MATAPANGIEISYEVGGTGEPLLLIMGLGGQLTDWHPALVAALERYFTVIRFDNRDTGMSTWMDAPVPTRRQMITAALWPSREKPAYELSDMADDAAGLLTHLGHERAHVVGMSMGGMIAQLLTIRHPHLVHTLCSVMSNTGDRRHGSPTPRVVGQLIGRGEPEASEALQVTMELFRLVGGPDWDPDEQRRRSTLSIERAYNPAGVLRQSFAIASTSSRTQDLGAVRQPTLVMHGLDDPLVRPSGGIATARAIPHSKLLMFPRMGHDLPATRHHEMIKAIVANAASVLPTATRTVEPMGEQPVG